MMRIGNIILEQKVACTMEDGIVLYADIYRPDTEEQYPVLLMRQPYGRALASTVSHAHPLWYAEQGYIVVIQDVRGRGESEGEFEPFIHEAADGFTTVEWAATLSGSTGEVGMYGFSYQGLTQWAAASKHPKALKAIIPSMCPIDVYHGMIYPQGSFAIGNHLPWAYQLARDTAQRAGDHSAIERCTQIMKESSQQVTHLPIIDRDPLLEQYFSTYYDWVEHPQYDDYWEQRNWINDVVQHPIPTLHIGGWYDGFLEGTLQSYQALQATSDSNTCFHHLIIGPWTHIPWGRYAGGIDHGAESHGDVHLAQVRWFNYWLKGHTDLELEQQSPIRYYERGSQQWLVANHVPEEAKQLFYLSSSAIPANGSMGGGQLIVASEKVSGVPDVFVYDARLPMPASGWLPLDRNMQQDRYEILVYTSEPLPEDISLWGTPSLDAYVQSVSGATELVATLSIITAEGKAQFVTLGRVDIAEPSIDQAQPEHVCIQMRPVGIHIPAGSMIRLELTGSAFPLIVRHPNNGSATTKHTVAEGDLQMATVVVYHSPDWLSHVSLPRIVNDPV